MVTCGRSIRRCRKEVPEYRQIPLHIADSVAFDFHKWFYVNYEVGCILTKHAQAHHDSFAYVPAYLQHGNRGIQGGIWFSDFGVELSRNFKALKVWTMIKELGTDTFRKTVVNMWLKI